MTNPDALELQRRLLLQQVRELRLRHELELKPLYDQLIRIESITVRPVFLLADGTITRALPPGP